MKNQRVLLGVLFIFAALVLITNIDVVSSFAMSIIAGGSNDNLYLEPSGTGHVSIGGDSIVVASASDDPTTGHAGQIYFNTTTNKFMGFNGSGWIEFAAETPSIAFDASSKGTTVSATSLAISHTISGIDRMLLVGFLTNNTSDIITGVTYNGTSMTRLKTQATGDGFISYVYGLLSPDTGTHNIVISASANSLIYATNASYTGVDQSVLPTGTALGSNNTTGTTWSQSVTTPVTNCWIFAHGRNPPLQTVTSGTVRATNNPVDGMVGDRGSYASSGSNTIDGTNGGPPANQTTIAVAFCPSQ